ncbi:MAG: hypothetical protein EBZ69_02800 [Alphaproteobacteria bacterium]|nr:hypothetical protein [Alphaproteobacteria bacterium]NDC55730.1 hypothetical protein [Alphaproteobacteria bacterium]NDG04061.1 hypothetical protein [Alphaproteobacteria bacterium]
MKKPAPEYSFMVQVLRLKPSGEVCQLNAPEPARRALCHRLDLLSLDSLTATLTLTPEGSSQNVAARGVWSARYAQRCVVTLEAVAVVRHNIPLHAVFMPRAAMPDDVSLEDDEDIEEIPANGEMDVGEWVVQHLAAQLDPYPRRPDAVFEGVKGDDARQPFATLIDIRDKLPKGKQ